MVQNNCQGVNIWHWYSRWCVISCAACGKRGYDCVGLLHCTCLYGKSGSDAGVVPWKGPFATSIWSWWVSMFVQPGLLCSSIYKYWSIHMLSCMLQKGEGIPQCWANGTARVCLLIAKGPESWTTDIHLYIYASLVLHLLPYHLSKRVTWSASTLCWVSS